VNYNMPQPVTILYAGPYRGGLVVNLTNHRTIRVLRKHRADSEIFEELVSKTALALNRKPENVSRALKERFF